MSYNLKASDHSDTGERICLISKAENVTCAGLVVFHLGFLLSKSNRKYYRINLLISSRGIYMTSFYRSRCEQATTS